MLQLLIDHYMEDYRPSATQSDALKEEVLLKRIQIAKPYIRYTKSHEKKVMSGHSSAPRSRTGSIRSTRITTSTRYDNEDNEMEVEALPRDGPPDQQQ